MAQIIRKWIEDAAVNNEKLDPEDVYTVTGLRVDSTSAVGRVGIGVTVPLDAIHIERPDTSAGLMLYLNDGSDGRNYQIYSGSSGVMNVRDYAIGVDRFTVKSTSTTGNVGVSTSDPQDNVHLRESTPGASAAVRIDLDDGLSGRAYRLISNPAGELVIQDVDAAATRMTIDSTGTTTFAGDTTVSGNFEVDGTVTVINTEIVIADQLEINQTDATQAALIASQDNASATETVVKVENASASAHALTVDQGNVGFGTTNPVAEVHVEGDIVGKLTASASNIGSTTRRIGTLYMASNIDYESNLDFSVGGVSQITFDTTNGRVGIGTTLPGQSLAVIGAINGSTTVTAGTGITATTGNIAASSGNVTASAQVNAGSTMTAGTGITATTGNIAASSGNVTASAQVNAGSTMTAGTGITATTGNIAASSGNVTASGQVNSGSTMTASSTITSTTGNIVATAGQVIAGTGITANTGNITATAGKVVAGTDMTAALGISAGTTLTTGSDVLSGRNFVTSTGKLAVGTTTHGSRRVNIVETGPSDYALYATSNNGPGIRGLANSAAQAGVEGANFITDGIGILGNADIAGRFTGYVDATGDMGLDGELTTSGDIQSQNGSLRIDNGHAAINTTTHGSRRLNILETTPSDYAIYATSSNGPGIRGLSSAGFVAGVEGANIATGGIGIRGDAEIAGQFAGNIDATGDMGLDGNLDITGPVGIGITGGGITKLNVLETGGGNVAIYSEASAGGGVAIFALSNGNASSIGLEVESSSGKAIKATSSSGLAGDFQGDVQMDKGAINTTIHGSRRLNVLETGDNLFAVYAVSSGDFAKGVYGEANHSFGVGVDGLSASGTGIRGTGGNLAGEFLGNVNITGDTTVGGHIGLGMNPTYPISVQTLTYDRAIYGLNNSTSGTSRGGWFQAGGAAFQNYGCYASAIGSVSGTDHPFHDNYGNYSDMASGWVNGSHPSLKRNIRDISEDDKDMLWSALDSLNVKGYRFKAETIIGYDEENKIVGEGGEEVPAPIYDSDDNIENYQEKFGLLSDELPAFLESADKRGIGAKKVADFLVAIAQMQKEKIIEQESQISNLLSRVAALEG